MRQGWQGVPCTHTHDEATCKASHPPPSQKGDGCADKRPRLWGSTSYAACCQQAPPACATSEMLPLGWQGFY